MGSFIIIIIIISSSSSIIIIIIIINGSPLAMTHYLGFCFHPLCSFPTICRGFGCVLGVSWHPLASATKQFWFTLHHRRRGSWSKDLRLYHAVHVYVIHVAHEIFRSRFTKCNVGNSDFLNRSQNQKDACCRTKHLHKQFFSDQFGSLPR